MRTRHISAGRRRRTFDAVVLARSPLFLGDELQLSGVYKLARGLRAAALALLHRARARQRAAHGDSARRQCRTNSLSPQTYAIMLGSLRVDSPLLSPFCSWAFFFTSTYAQQVSVKRRGRRRRADHLGNGATVEAACVDGDHDRS